MNRRNELYCDLQCLHQEVTGSSILVVVRFPNGDRVKFLVDCGLFQEKEYLEYNKSVPFNPQDLSFVLITHTHVDHVGRLALLAKKGYSGPYFASSDTCRLLPLALRDSCRILSGSMRGRGEDPIFNECDVANVVENLLPVKAKQEFTPHQNVKVVPIRNNHLVGAFSYLVRISYPGYEEINVFFTGDIKENNIFLEKSSIPKWIRELPLIVVTEATYGNERFTGQPVFRYNLLKTIRHGGSIVLPAFSLGRSQEVLFQLKKLQAEGKLSQKVPIYLDGKLAVAYSKVFLKGDLETVKPSMRNFIPENFYFVEGDKKACRRDIKASPEQKIIVASSGMGTFGTSPSYIQHYIQIPNSLIHFTGYCTEGSVGRKLRDAQYGDDVVVGGLLTQKQAEVQYTDEFSAHAHMEDLIDYLSVFHNIKLLVVNHGEQEAKEQLASVVKHELPVKEAVVLNREIAVRCNPFGFEKTFNTKF